VLGINFVQKLQDAIHNFKEQRSYYLGDHGCNSYQHVKFKNDIYKTHITIEKCNISFKDYLVYGRKHSKHNAKAKSEEVYI
jgi:hypothetical protein